MCLQISLKFINSAILVLLLLSGCGGNMPAPISEAPTDSALPEPLTPSPIQPTITPGSTATPESTFRILFIGNSLTYSNEGLDYHLNQLVGSSNLPNSIEAESVVRPGATLESLWVATNAREAINEGNYDVVVLQEDLPETEVETFYEYARKFIAEIEKVGAEPVLFMAWPYERLGWITMDEIAQAHFGVAKELGVDVAPVGLAMEQAMKERPEIDMLAGDAEHPSIYGTYLAVNTVYATIFGESPVGLVYLPPESYYLLSNGEVVRDVTDEQAAFLQRIAWEIVQEYRAQK